MTTSVIPWNKQYGIQKAEATLLSLLMLNAHFRCGEVECYVVTRGLQLHLNFKSVVC